VQRDASIQAIGFQDLGRQRFVHSSVAERVLAERVLAERVLAERVLAERVLAERLGGLGIHTALRPDPIAREIVGVDEDVMDLFSRHRQASAKAVDGYASGASTAPRMNSRQRSGSRSTTANARSNHLPRWRLDGG
jgi:hypothetical protein